MNIWIFFSFINGITALTFGTFVYFKGREKTVNRCFLLMNIGVSIWAFSYCIWLYSTNESDALFWSKMLNFGATLIPIFYLHWVLSFLKKDKEYKPILFFGYLTTLIFTIFSFHPIYIKSVKRILNFPYWPQAGPLYICFIFINYIGLISFALYQLFKNRKIVSHEKKVQIDYIILGTILGFGGGATNFPLMMGIEFLPPIGQPLVAFYVFLFSFAITRYHLFGIEVILTEILVFVIGVVILIQIFTAPNLVWKFINGIIFLLFLIFGYLLIRATYREIKRKEEAEKLALQERALREEAERLSRAKDQFILSIQHHLRTPLTPVMGYLSMILEGIFGEIKNKKIKEKLIAMQKSVNVLHKLMEDLLDINQLRVGKKILSLEKVNLEEIIKEVIEELEPQAKEKGLYIKFKKEILPEMKLDRMRIKEAIFNLLDNAIKYTQKGGVEINCKLENAKCKIEIKDTGIGMTKEEIENFLRGTLFERGKEAKKAWGPGRGIGLAIAIEFIKAHGGKIIAQSEGRNKGTTFIVELPLK